MKYMAILNDEERELDVVQISDHHFRVTVDGTVHEVDARDCGPDRLSALVDNVSFDISYASGDSELDLNFRNRYFKIDVLDERRMRMRQVLSELELSGGLEVIKTSMPGKVVKILVEKGQEVNAGDGIIIIEAMKMENEIRCKNSGTVNAIHVETGQAVEGNAPLIEIEPPE